MNKKITTTNGNTINFNNVKKVSISDKDIINHNGIISARNIADMSATYAVDFAKRYLASADNTLFNAVVLCGYAIGIKIPAFTDASGNKVDGLFIEKPMKQADMVERLDRDKSTISKWMKALRFIIDNNTFDLFAQGYFPFKFDNIIAYYTVLKDSSWTLKRTIESSLSTIREAVKAYKDTTASAKSVKAEAPAPAEAEAEAEAPAKVEAPAKDTEATFIYQGTTYKVSQNAIETFIKQFAKSTLTA